MMARMSKKEADLLADPLKEYKTDLIKVLEKSQDNFEKQLSYISAGGLGLSMIFIDKIVKNVSHADFKWLLAGCWFFLGCTLVVNLISHLVSARYVYKNIDEIENDKYNSEKISQRTR